MTRTSQPARTASGRPVALRAEADRRRPLERLQGLAAVSDQSRPRLGGRLERRPHQRLGEDRPHARPNRPGPEGVGASRSQDYRAADQGEGGPDHGADVSGIGDAMEIDAGGDRLVRPAALPDADRAGARAERGEAIEERRLDLGPTQPLPGRGEQLDRLGAGLPRRRQQVLALADEEAIALPRPPPLQAPDQLQLLVVGAGDQSISASSRQQKGRPLCGPPGKVAGDALAQAAAPSRARSTNRRKPSGSLTAISASSFRLTSTPAWSRPWMNSE